MASNIDAPQNLRYTPKYEKHEKWNELEVVP